MSKTLASVVIGLVGSAVLASSVLASVAAFDSAPIENIEKDINILKDKVVAFSRNEEKIIDKYMKLYKEYTKLKEATDKEDSNSLESEVNRLKKELEKREQDKQEQESYIKELEEQIQSLESVQEEPPQVSNELEVE
ncbi:hypothetical protein CYL18_06275 [Pradoshia eiseniae]|uniref:Spindle pole body component Bbp1 C-terminal domain-containing protein n=1 Tax=Pradoshia eiseniae TaxID=2064768 RepID=A0A2S7N281_9BACI|nr:hypothetical protein [Pradoshia eiseniae]PQD96201.1 hypothetical protein CYL18_06275 [Pradoshia eiseniae]